jgi:hypothetical protein
MALKYIINLTLFEYDITLNGNEINFLQINISVHN